MYAVQKPSSLLIFARSNSPSVIAVNDSCSRPWNDTRRLWPATTEDPVLANLSRQRRSCDLRRVQCRSLPQRWFLLVNFSQCHPKDDSCSPPWNNTKENKTGYHGSTGLVIFDVYSAEAFLIVDFCSVKLFQCHSTNDSCSRPWNDSRRIWPATTAAPDLWSLTYTVQ
jgi:hypothetical protein